MICKTSRTGMALALAFILIGATGCLSLNKSAPEKHFHVLDVQRPGAPRTGQSDGVLKLAEVRISPRYDKNELIYRIGPLEYETDFYNEFFISPRELIGEEALRWLGDSGLFRLVVGDDYRMGVQYILTLAVNSLYGDYRDPAAPQAVLNIQVMLAGMTRVSSSYEVLFTRDYSQSVALTGRDANACVTGLNQALADILGQLEIDLAGVVGDK